MPKVLSIEEIKNRIKEIHGDFVILDELTYVDTKTKCRFIDKDYGEFWNTPNNIFCKKQGHILRSNNKRKQTTLLRHGEDYYKNLSKQVERKTGINKKYTIEEINEKLKGKNVIFFDKEYIGNHVYHIFKCLICQDTWKAKTRKVLNQTGCPNCYGNKRLDIEFVRQFLLNNNIILVSSIYKNNREKIEVKCKACNTIWKSSFWNLKSGSGCPRCAIEKRKQTWLQKYGVDNPQKSQTVRNKTTETFKKRHGVEFPYQSKEFLEKSQNTCLERYGVSSPSRNLEIARKTARSSNRRTEIIHWKTNEIQYMIGWDPLVAVYFNKDKINYEHEMHKFTMPNGKVYIPDFYLPDKDIYIEVKGFFRKDAKEKWEWFHKEHPNSELWDQKKLKELHIL